MIIEILGHGFIEFYHTIGDWYYDIDENTHLCAFWNDDLGYEYIEHLYILERDNSECDFDITFKFNNLKPKQKQRVKLDEKDLKLLRMLLTK